MISLLFAGRMVYLSLGARLSERLLGKTTRQNVRRKEIFYKVTTFALTYLTYFAYHIAKRPISIMETSKTFLSCESFVNVSESTDDTWCSWAWIDQMSGVAQVGTILVARTLQIPSLTWLTFPRTRPKENYTR